MTAENTFLILKTPLSCWISTLPAHCGDEICTGHSSRHELLLPVPSAPKLTELHPCSHKPCSAQPAALARAQVCVTTGPSSFPAPSYISYIPHAHPSRPCTWVRWHICPCAPCTYLSQAAHPTCSLRFHFVTSSTKLAFWFMWLSPLRTISIYSSLETPLSPPILLPQAHTSVAPLPP